MAVVETECAETRRVGFQSGARRKLPAISAASSQLLSRDTTSAFHPAPTPPSRPVCYDLRLFAAVNAWSKALRALRDANGSHSGYGSSSEYV